MAVWKKLHKAIMKTGRGEAVMAALDTKKGRQIAAAALANTLGTGAGGGEKKKAAKLVDKKAPTGAKKSKGLLKPAGLDATKPSKKGMKKQPSKGDR